MGAMLVCSLAEDKYIVHIHQDAYIQQVSQQQVHATLEMGWCVLKSKRHDVKLKSTITTCERSLEPVRFLDRHLMVPIAQIELAKVLRAM